MNTVSIVGSLSRRAGGLFESVRRLHQELLRQSARDENFRHARFSTMRRERTETKQKAPISIRVLGLQDPFTEQDLHAWEPVPVHAFKTHGPAAFGYSPALCRELFAVEPELVHLHGLWQFNSVAALLWRRQTGRPLIVSPHGMLDRWALKNSSFRKLLTWIAYERGHLRSATCIRALCQAEATSIRALGLRNPVCIIPNGVDLPTETLRERTDDIQEIDKHRGLRRANSSVPDLLLQKRKALLYLGRIHPKKGLVNLLRAWGKMPQLHEWVLVIAGWDQGGHEVQLKQLASELGIRWTESDGLFDPAISLLFAGPQFGADKHRWFQRCDAVILPSFSEGLPMVVLEAWAHRKLVLMTPQCNLPEGYAAGAAFSISPETEAISIGLERLFQSNRETVERMGLRGYGLVSARFAWPQIAAELKSVYCWMSGAGPKPECVLIA